MALFGAFGWLFAIFLWVFFVNIARFLSRKNQKKSQKAPFPVATPRKASEKVLRGACALPCLFRHAGRCDDGGQGDVPLSVDHAPLRGQIQTIQMNAVADLQAV